MQGERGADHEVCIPAETGSVDREEIDDRIAALDTEIALLYRQMTRAYEKVIPKTGKRRREALDKVLEMSEKYSALCLERAGLRKAIER